MSVIATIFALVFSGLGVSTPVHQPDGHGGIITYNWTMDPNECRTTDSAIIFSSGNHGWVYFCEVKP